MTAVLVVDDEQDIRLLLTMMLKKRGYEVSQAISGEEALEMVRQNSYSLVLSDIRMPNGDGIWLLEQLKDIPNAPPVIVVTGFSGVEDKQLVKLGATTVMYKPVRMGPFLDAVDSALHKVIGH